jgi:uncharacterized protein YciI
MLYALICTDKPGALALRQATRGAHLAWIATLGDRVKVAGPCLDDAERDPVGSLIVIEAASRAEIEALAAADPYAIAGLFERVEIRPWRWLFGDGRREGA